MVYTPDYKISNFDLIINTRTFNKIQRINRYQ